MGIEEVIKEYKQRMEAHNETEEAEKEEIYRLYKNMTKSMQKAVKDVMLVVNGKEIK